MKKQVSPAVVVVLVLLVLGVAGYLFYKGTATPEAVNMSPQGPAAKLLKAGPGGRRMSPDVLEAQKMQQSQSAAPGK